MKTLDPEENLEVLGDKFWVEEERYKDRRARKALVVDLCRNPGCGKVMMKMIVMMMKPRMHLLSVSQFMKLFGCHIQLQLMIMSLVWVCQCFFL